MLHDVSEHTHTSGKIPQQRPPYASADSFASLSSLSSVIIKRDNPALNTKSLTHSPQSTISPAQIANLQAHASKIRSSAEIRRYIHNIVTFLRLHRGVAGGVSALAARNLPILARYVIHMLPIARSLMKMYLAYFQFSTRSTTYRRAWLLLLHARSSHTGS